MKSIEICRRPTDHREVTHVTLLFTLSLYMTMEEKISRYEAIRKEYQEKICHRMSKEQYEEYSEILFSTHSCAIEGNSFTVDDTRALKELGLGMIPHGRKLLECMEMADHLRAYEYVMQNLDHPLDEAFLKRINFLLTEHTISYHVPDAVAGEYADNNFQLSIVNFQLYERACQSDVHPMIVASRFHGYYEYLHPFRDGNGRTGRLLSNYILMRKGHPQLVIYLEERQQYIAALKQIHTEGTDEHLTHFFLDIAIRHMEEDLR